jgi:hypothetical protein
LLFIFINLFFQYARKSKFFGHAGAVVRAALTAIDNNINAFRGQATTATGLKRFNIVCNR